ncbi:MAG: VOC family protein [Sciscionella sp.]
MRLRRTDARDEQQPPQDGITTQVLKVRAEDVNAHFERARSHCARILEPPTDREYGECECTLEDLAGHRWQFTQTIRDVAPEEYDCTSIDPWRHSPELSPH